MDTIASFITKIALDNAYNPVEQYLKEKASNWDGKSRIQDICNTIVSPITANHDLKELLVRKWLLTCVHMAFNNGNHKAEGVLVIKGKQGIGKTRWN